MARVEKNVVRCPQCQARCINHRVFQSTRVADYANKRFTRYFRCGPINKDQAHVEHEWPVMDTRPGDDMLYTEIGDADEGDDNIQFGHLPFRTILKRTAT